MKRKRDLMEKVSNKSAAEFFSEHQQIAGFDNPGKSLFTTIRELVENSLDAAESIAQLPDIEVSITEYSEEEHNLRHGIHQTTTIDGSSASKKKESMYYDVKCRDNGCGIAVHQVGEMLGKVLSGSKHGVRQTRGKFGLGAKMALIWSKKSSGLPVTLTTAHTSSPNIHTITLDIDILANEPRILSQSSIPNTQRWHGVEMSLTIGGNWSNYRSKILQYFQQLAVITPYANISFSFTCLRDPKKNISAEFCRTSEQMPPAAKAVQPHPRSVNHITLSNLLHQSKEATVTDALCRNLSNITPKIASAITSAIDITCKPASISSSQVAALIQHLRDDDAIKPPAANCLSPAGEYNIRLGILKELQPDLVATYTDKPGYHEGHAFIVEAAISLGGRNIREGINIFRFANRIPMLFETGADVITQVAMKRIKWNAYLMDPKKDAIGIYVSIVSTKIPFKGTSKEYIGDDVKEIQVSVKRALQGCCQQLRVSLAEKQSKREAQERRKILQKYIPNISSSLSSMLEIIAAKPSPSPLLRTVQSYMPSTGGKIVQETLISKLEGAVKKLEAENALLLQAEEQHIAAEPFFLPENTFHRSPNYSGDDVTDDMQQSKKGRWVDIAGTLRARIWIPYV